MSQYPRRAYSLIELMVVLTMLGVLLGLVSSVFQLMIGMNRQLRDQFAQDLTFTRFYIQFVDDVHLAIHTHVGGDTTPAPKYKSLMIQVSNATTIKYQVKNRGCVERTVTRPGSVTGRERFRFSTEWQMHFKSTPGEHGECISWVMEHRNRSAAETKTVPWRQHVDAVVGMSRIENWESE